jgi:hypothetical protein
MAIDLNTSRPECSNATKPVRNIDTALLRTFVRVVESDSLAAAGLAMGRTQAAVSQQLSRLEQVVGQTLLARSGRKLVPTPHGIKFMHFAKRTLAIHDSFNFGARPSLISPAPVPPPQMQYSSRKAGAMLVSVNRQKNFDLDNDAITPTSSFESNLRNGRLYEALSYWRESRTRQESFSFEKLISAGLISRDADNCLLFEIRNSDIVCVDATKHEMRDLRLDQYGFGAFDYQLIGDPDTLRARRGMYMACSTAEVPVFYTGNAVMPANSPVLSKYPDYARVALDRLLLPVQFDGSVGGKVRRGVFILGAWDSRRFYSCLTASGERDPWNAVVPTITERVVFGF